MARLLDFGPIPGIDLLEPAKPEHETQGSDARVRVWTKSEKQWPRQRFTSSNGADMALLL